MNQAKNYSCQRYTLSIIGTFYSLALLIIFAATGLSKVLEQALFGILSKHYLVLPAYLLVISLAYYLLDFPLNFYGSFLLERKFSLSKQKFGNWFSDQLKAGVVSYIIALVLIYAFYYILENNPQYWWLAISLFWIFFSLVLARLTPIIIIPLFFKYKKLSDEDLRSRIMRLAEKMKVRIIDCFEIDFSKKTLKANAAFVGMGKSRRVILADTLKDKYSADEIEVILAHEFAHYRLKHLWKLVIFNSAVTVVLFYLIFKTSNHVLSAFGLNSLSELAALPIILIYFLLFGLATQPLGNFFSRKLEKNADKMALEVTGKKEAFISMMNKLAEQNLADRKPHPIIKFFFFDHPPIDERISPIK
ncbi:MAG: M48 family metallopeptidase [Candidatus Omnitrophica bacterium]|nr:M48 family metallopeptidase [Candidatus Omnitrophota bacterium]MDD5653196.1 M48 family metallopeptidase [Candidatus Omnitrophota bacterium]